MTPALAAICSELDVRVVPNAKHRTRGQGETCAERSMEKVLRLYGPGHLTIVLKSIVETENNGRQLVAPVIFAVSDIILAYPQWTATTAWLDALDRTDLGEMWSRAKANRKAAKPRDAIATMLFEKLTLVFNPTLQRTLI
jgi:hypothetical protein